MRSTVYSERNCPCWKSASRRSAGNDPRSASSFAKIDRRQVAIRGRYHKEPTVTGKPRRGSLARCCRRRSFWKQSPPDRTSREPNHSARPQHFLSSKTHKRGLGRRTIRDRNLAHVGKKIFRNQDLGVRTKFIFDWPEVPEIAI